MYKLEDRILFDGAAIVDAAAAQQQQEAQEAEAQQQTEQQDPDQHEQQNIHETSTNPAETQSNQTTEDSSDSESPIDQLLAEALNLDGISSDNPVNILVISSSLENADALFDAADSDTIVLTYDAKTTSAAQLLQQISEALDGKKADSIGFVSESADNAHLQLFADSDTTLESINEDIQQQFWNGLENFLDSDGHIDLFASNLASTEAGQELVDAISDTIDHEVSASTDLTGDVDAGGNWDLEYSSHDSDTLDVSDIYFDHDSIDNFDSLVEDHINREVAFINCTVKDAQSIIDGLDDDIDIVMLDQMDAFDQIEQYLSEHSDIESIRIFTHGNEGYFKIGIANVNNEYIQNHADQFNYWGDSLSQDADIMIYGCDLAASTEGQTLVQSLATLTGADIAASTDTTGLDGNWTLEFTVGEIETSEFIIHEYNYNLAEITLTVKSLEDEKVLQPVIEPYTFREALYLANTDTANDYVIKFADIKTLGGDTIYMNSAPDELGQYTIQNNLTIDGKIFIPDSGKYTFAVFDAQNKSRHFTINEDVNVVICNSIFTNGVAPNSPGEAAPGSGGSIYNAGTLWINDSMIFDSTAAVNGGAIYNTGDLTITCDSSANEHFIHWDSPSSYYLGNQAGLAGGAIFNSAEGTLTVEGNSVAYTVDFIFNSVLDGSGGGVYSVGAVSMKNALFNLNTANHGDGGGLYITSATGTTHLDVVDFFSNRADGDGGGLFFTEGNNLLLEWSYFDNNTAGDNGGGLFFEKSGNLTLVTSSSPNVGKSTSGYFEGNTAGMSGGGIYMADSGELNIDFYRFDSNIAGNDTRGGDGGGIYMTNSGNANIYELELTNNSASAGSDHTGYGGGFYYTNPSATGGTVSINASGISLNTAVKGGGIYQPEGDLTITNTTMAFNSADQDGGAIWFGEGNLALKFDTLAYNQAGTGFNGDVLYMTGPATESSNISIVNTIVFNNDAAPLQSSSQIYLGNNVSVEESHHNIFSHYDTNVGANLALSTYTDIHRIMPNGTDVVIGQVDANGNIVGDNSTNIDGQTYTDKVEAYLYLDTDLKYHANFRTRSLSLLYKESLAYGAGVMIQGITHDQRGNVRQGFDKNGNLNATPSIGAFEPIYYLTVDSKGDDSKLVYHNDANGHYLDSAMSSGSGLTLREAVYWLDTYNPDSLPANVLVDTNRYVKFSEDVFVDNGSTILLLNGDIKIGGSVMGISHDKQIRIGITPDDIWQADNSYVAQDADNRITVDGNNKNRIFTIASGTTAIISNLTLQNGYTTSGSANTEGKGGAINNAGTTTLNNVVVQDSKAENSTLKDNYANTGWGGGIYNRGTMYIYDSTISNNQAVAHATDKKPANNAGLGGGIYNAGTLLIDRSTIDHNSVSGNIQYVDNSIKGGGIYNQNGSLNVSNTTIAYNDLDATQNNKGQLEGTGSAIYVVNGNARLYYNTIVYNTSLLNSGAEISDIYAAITVEPKTEGPYGTIMLSNSIVAQNTVRLNKADEPQVTPIDIYVQDSNNVIISADNAKYNIISYFNYTVDPDTGIPTGGFNWADPSLNNRTGDDTSQNVLLYMSDELAYNGGKTMNFRLFDGSMALNSGSAIAGYNVDQRGASRSQLDRYGNTTPSIGAYEALTEVYVTASGDTGSLPSLMGFDFSKNRPGFYADTVTVRDAFYWADPDAVVRVRYADGTDYWTSDTVKLEYGQLEITKGFDFYGDVNYFNYVGNNTDQKVLIDYQATNRYFYDMSETGGKTIFYDIYRTEYYYIGSEGQNVYLTAIEVNASEVTTTNVTDANGNVKYTTYSDASENRLLATGDDSNRHYYYFTESGDRIAMSKVAAAEITDSTNYATRAFNTNSDIVIDAQDKSRVIRVDNDNEQHTVDVNLFNFTAQNGNATAALYNSSSQGGGIFSFENLTLLNVTVDSSSSDTYGGGVYIQAGDLNVINSTISNNESTLSGGGIFSTGGDVIIDTSSLLSNSSQLNGAGMYVEGANNFAIWSSTIGFNHSEGHGGGIYSDSSNLQMVNTSVSNNESGLNGGGINFSGGGTLALNFSTVANNTAGLSEGLLRSGGGIYQSAGTFVIQNSILAQNWYGHYDGETLVNEGHNDYIKTGDVVVHPASQYSIIGESNYDFHDLSGMIVLGELGNTNAWSELRLDTTLSQNGGTTLTVYVQQDSIAIGHAAPGSGISVNMDQRGELRPDGTTDRPTIGAFEKVIRTYYYIGTDTGDVTDTSNWQTVDGNNPLDFDTTVDQIFVFDNDTATLTAGTVWDVNSKSFVRVYDGTGTPGSASLTIADDATVNAFITIGTQGQLNVAGTWDVLGTDDVIVLGALNITGVITATTRSTAAVTVEAGATLTLATADKNVVAINLKSTSATSEVKYTHTGNQTIKSVETGNYGILTLGGNGSKNYNGDLTAEQLNFLSGVILDVNGSLTINAGGSDADGAQIKLTGNLTIDGSDIDDFAQTDLFFDGDTVQTIEFTDFLSHQFDNITIDNSAGVRLGTDSNIEVNNFEFIDGAFTLYNGNLIIKDGGNVTGASGQNGRYFVTAGIGSVSLPVSVAGTHFVLAVYDDVLGEYKWTDTILANDGRVAMRLINNIAGSPVEGQMTVTWHFENINGGDFGFNVDGYSNNVANDYFELALSSMYFASDADYPNWGIPQSQPWTLNPDGYFYLGNSVLRVTNTSGDASVANSLAWAIDQINTNASYNYRGVIMFDDGDPASPNFEDINTINLVAGLKVAEGVTVTVIGLQNKVVNVVGPDGETTLTVGDTGGLANDVKFKHLNFQGNNTDYVLVNQENLYLYNVSVTTGWNNGTIDNQNNIYVMTVLSLDGSADGYKFNYAVDSTLRYTGDASISINDNSAEFSDSLYNLALADSVSLTLNNLSTDHTILGGISSESSTSFTIGDNLTVTGDTALAGNLNLNSNQTLKLLGTNNNLGNFAAANDSTVNYAGANDQTVYSTTYYNLAVSGSGTKTASAGLTATNLTVASGSELAFSFATDDNVNISNSIDVDGTLTFTNLGNLNLYENNNAINHFNYGQSTVNYLGTDQDILAINYYNLVIGDGTLATAGTKTIGGAANLAGLFTVHGDMTINSHNTVLHGTHTLIVRDTFTLASDAEYIFTAESGLLELAGVVNAEFSFTDGLGTIVYSGISGQEIATGHYNNLIINNGDKYLRDDTTVHGYFGFYNNAGRLLLGNSNLIIEGNILNSSGIEGQYFAFNEVINSGKLIFSLGAGISKAISVGTAATWSTLTFTGGEMTQNMSIWVYDGVNTNGSPYGSTIPQPEYAVNMTFNVNALRAASYSMVLDDSSAKGSLYDPNLSVAYHFDNNQYKWSQTDMPTNLGGAFFFGMGLPNGGLVVSNANDSGVGSLRWAINAANIFEGVNEITFSEDFFYMQRTIHITSEMSITDSVIISGLGTNLIIVDADGNSRIFNIASNTLVTINGITITDGDAGENSGGAIYTAGGLRLENVEISSSSTSANGGAIFVANDGELHTMKVTISDSSAAEGNAIYSLGKLSMFNSTIAGTGNQITIVSGSASLFNVTIAETNAGNAVTVDESVTLDMNNTLVYGAADFTFTGSRNVITSDNTLFVGDTPTLADNGGWVRTIAVKSDASIIINRGLGYSAGAYEYDSRGYLVNGANDIGAYEVNGFVARNAEHDKYYSTVSAAIIDAFSGDTIELVDTRILQTSEVIIDKDITISGNGAWTTVLDATENSRVFTIGDSVFNPAVHMLNFAIRNGAAIGNGGAIQNFGNLHMLNMMIAGNTATESGAGIYNAKGSFLYVDHSSIRGNAASLDGGGIYNLGEATVINTRIANNTATVNGGGIYNGILGDAVGQLYLLKSTVDANTATAGGGIYSTGTIQAEVSTIHANSATTFGGGIYSNGDSNLINLTVAYNHAGTTGGGLYFGNGTANVINTIVSYNSYADGYSDISDSNHVVTETNNFVGENVSGFYTSGDVIFSGALTDNGGWTYTLALNSTSSSQYVGLIVNQGVNTGNNYDQRGYMVNGIRDIGAYETDGYVAYRVYDDNTRRYYSSIESGLNTFYSDGTLYLLGTRIKESNISPYLTTSSNSPKNITIVGDASGATVISAGKEGRVFYLNATKSTSGKGGSLTLTNVTVADGSSIKLASPLSPALDTDGYGGAIYLNGAQLILNGVNIIDSSSSHDGGAIFAGKTQLYESDKFVDVFGTVTSTDSFIGNNFAGGSGGAIAGIGTVTLTSSTLYGNMAGISGGAISLRGEHNLTISNSTIAYNNALKGLGGGVYLASQNGKATFSASMSLFARNYNGLSFDREGIVSTVDIGNGDEPPTSSTIGNAGDFYLNTENGDWYSFDGAEWTLLYNIGEQYYSDILSGTGIPTAETGENGDYYVNTNTGDVFHKDNGSWGETDTDGNLIPLYSLYSQVTVGTGEPASSSILGELYIDSETGRLYKNVLNGMGEPRWEFQWDMNGTPEMLAGSGSPSALVGKGGDYYLDKDTGLLYVRVVEKFGATGEWSHKIATLKSSDTVRVGSDYYYNSGKLSDSGYNLVEYQNGTWTKDTPNFFGEKTYDEKDPDKIKTNKHDIVGAQETIFVTGVTAKDNGGWSWTLELAGDGAATDSGTGSSADQRGYSANSTADIGAYEYKGFVATVGGQQYDSVQKAVNAASDGDTITLNSTRILENDIAVNKNITFQGTAGETYLSAGYMGRVVHSENANTTVSFQNMALGEGIALDSTSLQGASAVGNGGAVFSNGSVAFTNVQVLNSFAQRSGGGSYSIGTTSVTATGNDFSTLFINNRANVAGGAIFSNGAFTVSVSNDYRTVQFLDNSAGENGGAIATRSNAAMQYFVASNNRANLGGAISLTGTGNAVLQDFNMENNFATLGGAIYVNAYGNLDIIGNNSINANFDNNRAILDGGAIYMNNSGNLLLTGVKSYTSSGTSLTGNNAGRDGGAVFVNSSGSVTVNYFTSFSNNAAESKGGAIYINDSAGLSFGWDNTVSNNTAGLHGGAVYMQASDSFTTNNSANFSYNTAVSGSGGGIYLKDVGTVSVNYTQANNNTAGTDGGFIYITNSSTTDTGGISFTDLDAFNNKTDSTPIYVGSIAISGEWALVGLPDTDLTVTDDPGRVQVYRMLNGAWISQQILTTTEGGDLFGFSVSVDGINGQAVIGATNGNNGTGAAYLYTLDANNVWQQQSRVDGENVGDQFGYSVSISNNNAVIGAPLHDASGNIDAGAVYFYTLTGSTWNSTGSFYGQNAGDQFGFSVAVSGTNALVGAPYWDYSSTTTDVGAVYFFNFEGGAWDYNSATFGSLISNHYFGYSVAISGDKAVIGAPGQGYDDSRVYFLDFNGSEWDWNYCYIYETGQYGHSVSISGDTAIIGDSQSSSVAVYKFSDSQWGYAQSIDEGAKGVIGGDKVFIISDYSNYVQDVRYSSSNWTADRTIEFYSSNGKGGTIYIDNGNDAKITISRSSFDSNFAAEGSGVWINHGEVNITNATFGFNTGSALYFDYGTLNLNFTTFAYNNIMQAGDASSIQIASSNNTKFSIQNSIIWDYSSLSVDTGTSAISQNSNNLFRDATSFAGSSLYGNSFSTIIGLETGQAGTVRDSNGNLVGWNTAAINFLNANTYLSSKMLYHANYRTRAFGLDSVNSVAYRYQSGNSIVRAGKAFSSVTTDQRGNARNGYTFDSNSLEYRLNNAPSIGAFEPIFYLTVTDKGDMSYDPFSHIVTSGLAANAWFADAISEDGSLNLREASYWIDSYNPNENPFDANRYIKFSDKVFTADGDNTISLNVGAIEIYTSQIIGMIPNYEGFSGFNADNTYMAQDASSRITIDGHNSSRIFSVLQSFNSGITVGINNLNIVNGREVTYGGGIYNASNLILNNVVVTNNTVSSIHNYNYGGAIYNNINSTLRIYDSTISNNSVTGDYANGGALYNAGDAEIYRSLISSNFATDAGGGIYNVSGNLKLVSNTITGNTISSSSTQKTGSAIYVEAGNLAAYYNTIVNNPLPSGALDKPYGDKTAAVYLGNALVYTGDTPPSTQDDLKVGTYGDYYIDEISGNIYKCYSSGNWANMYNLNIFNTFGGKVVYTDSGHTGDYYFNPVTNSLSIIGSGVLTDDCLSGTANPDAALGANGDYYLNTDTSKVYLKTNGVWTMLNVILDGSSIPKNWQGVDGNYYINKSDGQLFKKDAGEWVRLQELIINSGSAVLKNNIIANNNANGTAGFRGRDIFVGANYNITEEGNNIIGYYNGNYDFSATSSNIMGNSVGEVRNLNLDTTLKYNGGITKNFRLLANSVAADAGTEITGINYDQRGATREYTQSIGAYELLTQVTVDSSEDTNLDYSSNPDVSFDFENNRGGWNVSLRNALYLADNGATVTIDSSGWAADPQMLDHIDLKYGQLQIGTGLTLTTKDDALVTIDGKWDAKDPASGTRIFWIDSNTPGLVDVTLENLVLQNGNALTESNVKNGGAIYNAENLTLSNVTVKNSQAENGGGIFTTEGALTLTDSSIVTGNKATISGGGIYADAGSINLLGSVDGNGYHFVSVSNNTTDGHGGGIYAINSTVNTSIASINDNMAKANGGGAYMVGTTLNMDHTEFMSNEATYDGGALYFLNGAAHITSATFGLNEAGRYGGGIFANAQRFELINSTVGNNTSGAYGGGMYITGTGSYDLTYVTIANNIAGTADKATEIQGGGIYMGGGTLTMINSVVAQNYSVKTIHSDFYLASGNIASVTYSAIGESNYDFSTGTGNITPENYGSSFYSDLKLDTELLYNGGATKTLYVWQNSLLVGHGQYLADITDSQNGKARLATPTIGAYESRNTEYIYIGGDVKDTSSWQLNGGSTGTLNPDFNAADNLYIFQDGGALGNLSEGQWALSDRSLIQVAGSFIISGTATMKGFDVHAKDSNARITVTNTGTLTFSNGITSAISLETLDSNSNVVYNFNGNQSIYTANYGNLTIANSGTKSTNTSLTIAGSLTVNDTAVFNGVNLTIGNYILGNNQGVINAGTISVAGIGYSGNSFAGTINATNLTVNSGGMYLDGAVIGNDNLSTVMSVTGGINATAGNNVINSGAFTFYDSVNVADGSTLTFNLGNQNILLDDGSAGAGDYVHFNVTEINVGSYEGSDAVLTLNTSNTATLQNIDGTEADGIQGTLNVTGLKAVDLNGAVFNKASLGLNGPITLFDDFSINHNITFGGNVTINKPGGEVTVTSNSGSVNFTGSIAGTSNENLTIDANTGATIKNVNGINDLTVSTASGNIVLNGQMFLNGDATFNAPVVISGAATSVNADNITFANTVSGSGSIALNATTGGTFANDVGISGAMILSNGIFSTTHDVTAGSMSVNTGATLSMVGGTMDIGGLLNNSGNISATEAILRGDFTNTGTFTNGSLTLAGTSEQVLNLNGTENLSEFKLDNAAGARLASGNLQVDNFTFTNGKFRVGNNTVEVLDENGVSGADIDNRYFVMGNYGKVRQLVTANETYFFVGGEQYGSRVAIKAPNGNEYISVGTFGTITANSSPNDYTIVGIESTVKRTWTIDRTETSDIQVQFMWNTAEEGSNFGGVADLYHYQNSAWQVVGELDVQTNSPHHAGFYTATNNGSFVIAAPDTNFESPYAFKGLNDDQQKMGQPQDFELPVNVPESEGKAAYDVMQFRLNNSSLTNPLNGMVPRAGSQMALNLSLESNFEFAYGFSVYGTSDGEYALNEGEEYEEELDSDYYIIEEEIAVDPDMEEMFVEMASRDTLMEKHAACKNDLDKILDDLIAS
jgi:hypothetical protein